MDSQQTQDDGQYQTNITGIGQSRVSPNGKWEKSVLGKKNAVKAIPPTEYLVMQIYAHLSAKAVNMRMISD